MLEDAFVGCLAVEVVCCEPLSQRNSLPARKSAGNLRYVAGVRDRIGGSTLGNSPKTPRIPCLVLQGNRNVGSAKT